MILDYSRISFEEIDKSEMPYYVWYDYDISSDEMNDWLANEVTDDEIPRGTELHYDMNLLLTIFSKGDYKLEAVVQDIKGNRYEVELCSQFHNADEFITMIPNYGKLTYKGER